MSKLEVDNRDPKLNYRWAKKDNLPARLKDGWKKEPRAVDNLVLISKPKPQPAPEPKAPKAKPAKKKSKGKK